MIQQTPESHRATPAALWGAEIFVSALRGSVGPKASTVFPLGCTFIDEGIQAFFGVARH